MATAKRAHARGKRTSVRRKSISSRVRKDPHPRPLPTRGRGEVSGVSATSPKAKRKGGPIPGRLSPMRTRMSDELQAHARRLFEETDRFTTDIARDCGVDESVIRRKAQREGWKRYVPPPRDVPPVAKLLAEVEALEAMPPVTPEERVTAIDRLHREAMSQLAEVEALRARTTPAPKDAERNAHTLSSLTETMRKLQGMRCANHAPGSTHDDYAYDTPADPDAFRDELARRIDAFIASRANAGDAGDGATLAADAIPE